MKRTPLVITVAGLAAVVAGTFLTVWGATQGTDEHLAIGISLIAGGGGGTFFGDNLRREDRERERGERDREQREQRRGGKGSNG